MSDIQFKANTGQFNIDQAQGIVECFVAGIGNKDSVGDIVISGAFAKSLMRRKPRVVWGHNWNDPIGKVLEIYEVPPNDPRLPSKMKMAGIGGLYAKVQFNLNSEKGREAFANVAFFGEEQEWSIGYKTLDAIYDNSRQANVLREVELYEVSPVLHGANQLTGTISVKSDEEKMHMSMMGMPAMVAVQEKPKGPNDPFEQGVAQPADSDRVAALERELSQRTGGPVKVMKATESSVVFIKPGKGAFRLGYYFNGEQFMFGKPEKLSMPVMPVAAPAQPMPYGMPGMPGMTGKPNINPNVMRVRYGDDDTSASGIFGAVRPKDDEKSLIDWLDDILVEKKSDDAYETIRHVVDVLQSLIPQEQEIPNEFVIKCDIQDAFSTKQLLDPVFDYHRLESYVSEDGIVVASPMTQEAMEAVENATKGLGRTIGRALGGGGKVRRGRAALTRVTGELDPRKRRDNDGDGKIFDGTPFERTAIPNAPQRNVGLRSESNQPTTKRKRKLGEFALDPNKPRKDIRLTRQEQKKLAEMMDAVVKESSIDDNSPIKQVADAIRNAASMPNGMVPDISPELYDAFKKEYGSVRDRLQAAGGKKEGQRGRSAFDILDEFVEKGSYSRTNLGTDTRTRKGATAMSGRPQGKLEKPANSRSELIKKYMPEKWDQMQPDEKFDWWFTNAPKLRDESNNAEWRRMLGALEKEIVQDDEDFERKKSRRSQPSAAPQAAAAERTENKPEPTAPKTTKKPASSDDKFTESARAINAYVDKHRDKVTPAFADTTRNGLDEMASALSENDGDLTADNLRDAQEAIEKTISELQEMAADRKRKLKKPNAAQEQTNINRGEDESAASKREQDVISGMKLLSQALGEQMQSRSTADTESELDPEQDIIGRFQGDIGNMDADIEDVISASIQSFSRYTNARDRRRQGAGLRSQRGPSNKPPRTEITAESTWWKSIAESLPREIRATDDDRVRKGLELLKTTIERQKAGAFTPDSKRTNVGSLRITADEADVILDSVMAVVDRQMTAGKDGGVGSRAEIFAELLEKVARASMSTFIEKTSGPADE